MSDKLDKNILATIIYYDVLNYPLTAFEVWKYLIRTDYYVSRNEALSVAFAQIANKLQGKELNKYIEHSSGFYFLRGRKELVEKRIANNKISIGKIKKLQRIVWWLRFLPFVRMVGITGALAMKNAKVSSDLDLLIVLKYGKIWTGRTLVTVFLHIFKKRRHGEKVADRACLNHFITDQSLEVITKSMFSANEFMFLFPLYGWEAYHKFQIKNQWIRDIKPTYALADIAPLKIMSDSYVSKSVRNIGEMIFSALWLEKLLKKIEKKLIMNNPKTHQEGSLIYANDDALVFLPNPHGPLEFEKFKAKLEEIGA
jgi:hypothetical protein